MVEILNSAPVGTYRLKFMYIGYNSVLKTDIVVKSAAPAYVNAELEETVIEGSEVTVTAGYFVEEQKIQTSTIGLTREEIRRFPGGFEDVVRTASTLPDVVSQLAIAVYLTLNKFIATHPEKTSQYQFRDSSNSVA